MATEHTNKGKKEYKKPGPKGPSKWTEERINQMADALEEWVESRPAIPLLQDFALQQGIHTQRISEFAESNSRFSEALKRAKDYQVSTFASGMMTEELNATGTIFTLKNVAGWSNKEEKRQENTSTMRVEMVNYADADTGEDTDPV